MPIFQYTKTALPEVALAVATGAYTTGDVMGGLLTFDMRSKGNGGVIRRMRFRDSANQKAELELWLFKEPPTTTFADGDPFLPVEADLDKVIDFITMLTGHYKTENTRALGIVRSLDVDYELNDGIDNLFLYAYLVVRGTPTYGATTAVKLWLDYWEN